MRHRQKTFGMAKAKPSGIVAIVLNSCNFDIVTLWHFVLRTPLGYFVDVTTCTSVVSSSSLLGGNVQYLRKTLFLVLIV